MPRCSTPSCPPPTAISPIITWSCVSGSRPSRPAGCLTLRTGWCSTVCTTACASGWSPWPPTPTADPESELRRQLAAALVAAGQRLGSDHRLQEGLERVVESGARALADQFHDELADLVTGTIEHWDATETSSQLELLLGPDLQYIRINGTVVGAPVGLPS